MSADPPEAEPSSLASVQEFVSAYDAFHDRRRPTDSDTIDRAVRLASESMRAIDLQCRRVQGVEPEDDEWFLRVWMDFQFLVVALWRLRMAGRMVAVDEVREALSVFDREVPDLALMRHVSQHLDEYALDSPNRRQQRPGGKAPVGRRALEVAQWSEARFVWLGGTIEVAPARRAAAGLYAAIRQARDARA